MNARTEFEILERSPKGGMKENVRRAGLYRMVRNRASVDHYYIKVRSEVPMTHPPLIYMESPKPYFNKRVLIPDRPVNNKMLRSKYVMAGPSFTKLGRPKDNCSSGRSVEQLGIFRRRS